MNKLKNVNLVELSKSLKSDDWNSNVELLETVVSQSSIQDKEGFLIRCTGENSKNIFVVGDGKWVTTALLILLSGDELFNGESFKLDKFDLNFVRKFYAPLSGEGNHPSIDFFEENENIRILSFNLLLLKESVELAWENRELLNEGETKSAIQTIIELLDKGHLRVAEPTKKGWQVNEWIKKAVILYFPIQKMEVIECAPFEFHDKMKLKTGYKDLGVRVVPHAISRYGCYLAPGVVMMPSYANIGAYVDSGTMVDTWATVGSCAQIGKNVHLSGGVGIGGVLEPVQAQPVIIEDDCFIGSRCIVVEGVHLEKEVVLGANVVLTASTKIIDVSKSEPVEHKGRVPERSVVIPGTINKEFPAGTYGVPCALIIGQRKESTDKKTALNDALRDFKVAV